MALFDRDRDRAFECSLPGAHHRCERIAHRPRAVVELDRAADIDAAGIDLHRDPAYPALEERAQPRQATRLGHRGCEYFFFEARVVLADDRDLQLLARAKVGEDARL